jgi:hypothetical protein
MISCAKGVVFPRHELMCMGPTSPGTPLRSTVIRGGSNFASDLGLQSIYIGRLGKLPLVAP